MSKPFQYPPPEILDEIVDFLRDEPETLMQCCLVSKSWVPRARKHLFAQIWVKADDHRKWTSIFPDPEGSPAHYTRRLKVDCALEDSRWIQGFRRVEQLTLNCIPPDPDTGIVSLIPFRILATSLRSLCVYSGIIPHSQTFGLIRSLPLLEDLTLRGNDIDEESMRPSMTVPPSTSPAVTGSLKLFMYEGMENALREMLDLPGGLHFRELQLTWCGKSEFPWVAKLVATCSDTLECLDITCDIDSMSDLVPSIDEILQSPSGDEGVPGPIDLSKATKLKDIVFRCDSACCGWVTATLGTITPEHQDLRISLCVPRVSNHQMNNPQAIGAENTGMSWLDLDHSLVRLWESHSISLTVVNPQVGEGAKGLIEYLLPEVTRRGIAELEEFNYINDY